MYSLVNPPSDPNNIPVSAKDKVDILYMLYLKLALGLMTSSVFSTVPFQAPLTYCEHKGDTTKVESKAAVFTCFQDHR